MCLLVFLFSFGGVCFYPLWKDEGRVWNSQRTGIPTKSHGGLPRHSGAVPGTYRRLLESVAATVTVPHASHLSTQ